MTLSILHRGTGLALAVGFLVLAAWLVSAASGAVEYADFMALVATPLGRLLMIGWTFAFFYHLANGIRHLVWDAGHGFEKSQATASAWFVLVTATVATVIFWVVF
jgi:succinate dehydrogenase / fumarate reductase cytochrome b subunit